MSSASIRPLSDRVVLRPVEEKAKGSLVLPDSATDKPVRRGEILAVGPGKEGSNGHVRTLGVQAGQTVLYQKYSGTEVKLDDQDLVVIREDDIMGVLEGAS